MHSPACAGMASIPRWAKIAFTAFMAVLVPTYWHNYGPSNFLYFCDVALILTLLGMWLESPLLIGIPTVGIFLPQMLWVADYLSNLIGMPMSGLTDYMFDEGNPLFNRSLSLFHGWLPFWLLWLVLRLGYDRRSYVAWVAIAGALILICYAYFPPPPADPAHPNSPVNINYVYGLGNDQPQTAMPEMAWLALWMAIHAFVLAGPMHILLRRFVPERPTALSSSISETLD